MKYAWLFIIAFTIALTAQAQQFIWEKSFNYSPNADAFVGLTKDNDSSVVAIGDGAETGFYQSFFMEYRASGVRPWQKLGRKLWTGDQDIQPFKNGYFNTGSLSNNNITPRGYNIMLQRLNATGDTLWTRKYMGVDYNAVNRMMLNGNNIYLAGSGSNNSLKPCYVLMKTDTSGNLLWRKFFRSIWGSAGACDLVRRPNGNIIITGRSQTQNGTSKLYLLEVNPITGDSLRSAVITIKGSNYWEDHSWSFNNFSLTSDGNYICSGTIDSANMKLGYIAKIDTTYNVIWSRILPPHFSRQAVATNKVKELANSNFVIFSQDIAANNYNNVIYITKYSTSGQYISQAVLSSQFCNRMKIVDWEILADGTAIMAGGCLSNNEAYIARISQIGAPVVLPTGLPETLVKKELLGQSYPNPAAETAIIPFNLPIKFKQAQISIKDITGREIKSYNLKSGTNSLEVNLSNLSNGLYTYTLLVDDIPIATKKLAVSK